MDYRCALPAPYLPANLPHFAGACDKSHCGSRNSGGAYSHSAASKSEVGAYAIGRAEVLLTASVYFGIVAGGVINASRWSKSSQVPGFYPWFVPRVPPFQVRCERCGSSRIYRFRHVIVFEAPTIEDLDTHPAFRNV